MNDPCTDYAQQVIDGEIVVGDLIRRACQRHLNDLKRDDIHFDVKAAAKAYKFFGLLKHSKGQWAGQKFTLTLWQQFVIGSIFGWKREDGSRRFRVAHVEVARKNGKTTFAAGIGLYLLLMDNEAGAEVYNVATKRDQARIAHDESKRMVRASELLKSHIRSYRDSLIVEKTDGKYVPLGADGDTLDGLNISGAICDELHAWKQRDLWDVIETATGARRQPLILAITTAGVGRNGIWWERRDLAVKVLKGLVQDDSLFAAIYTIDELDDWTDETVWIKSNPSLGVSLRADELQEKIKEAIATPGKQNATKRLRLNVPTDQVDLWLSLDKWDKAPPMEGVNAPYGGRPGGSAWDAMKGRPCFAGVDLSATTDMSAAAYVFPPVERDEPWKALMRFWLPDDDIAERCKRDHADYLLWSQQGFLELIPGAVIEHEVIEARLREDAKRFHIQTFSFDMHMANQLTTRLTADGFNCEGFGQGYLSMASPVREMESMVASFRFAHGGHPVLRFNVGCAACKQDPAGNRKPDKSQSTGRIDGLVAVLNALGKAIVASDGTSVYSTRGLLVLGDEPEHASVPAEPVIRDIWQDDKDDEW